MNLIQAATQRALEMKEKIKILSNEIEILRNEVAVKDKEIIVRFILFQLSLVQLDN